MKSTKSFSFNLLFEEFIVTLEIVELWTKNKQMNLLIN